MINISRLPQKVEIKFWGIAISVLKASEQVQVWMQNASFNRKDLLVVLDTFQWIFLGVCGLVIGFLIGFLTVFFL
jgi:predicted Co/Zn/Cd cation transporter (cation efflux family)